LQFDELARITGGQLRRPETGAELFRGVSHDSRVVESGQLFIAVRGQRVDGHRFIDNAIAAGAAGIILEQSFANIDDVASKTPVVAVKDSHEAMMVLAEHYRSQCRAKIVGITGSNGKTTTKELTYRLIAAVESNVYRSPGNFNNLFGMPLALFAMSQDAEAAVMEMGISIPGEMTRLTRIVRPDVIVITNVGPSHLQYLESVEGVARAKLEMVSASPPDTPVIVNGDDPVLMKEASKLRSDLITFGLEGDRTYRPDGVETGEDGVPVVTIESHRFRLPLFGRYQTANLLAAYAAFRTLGYDASGINTETIELATAPMRGEVLHLRGVTFVADCYNANPDSMASALDSFEQRPDGLRRVVILGDMLELGAKEKDYHRDLGRRAAGMTCDLLVLVGPLSRHAADAAIKAGVAPEIVRHYDTAEACGTAMLHTLKEGDLVLVKASRGTGLEQVIDIWTSAEGDR